MSIIESFQLRSNVWKRAKVKSQRRRPRLIAWRVGWTLVLLGVAGPLLLAAALSLAFYGYLLSPGLADARLRNPKSIEHVQFVEIENGIVRNNELPAPDVSQRRQTSDRDLQTPYAFLYAYGDYLSRPARSPLSPSPPSIAGLFSALQRGGLLREQDMHLRDPLETSGIVFHFTSQDGEPLVGVVLSVYDASIHHARIVQVVARGSPAHWEILHARSIIAPIANQDEAPLFPRLAQMLMILCGIPIAVIGAIVLLVRSILLFGDLKPGQCRFCRYDMTGLAATTCPECGHADGLHPIARAAVSDAQPP